MTEFGDITGDQDALMMATYLTTIEEALNADALTKEGLDFYRFKLRHPDTIECCTRHGSLPLLRAGILDRIARLLADGNPVFLAYYQFAGDIIPTAPDDLSELDRLSE